ncbi:phospho-N-acetylmuramoyl-pentapeptide-transferase [Candidatus Poribacteria bacterium]|nr:phospho-N-acetylmuramoyl-pentapeptide-transferase [Candidatus Poribacteria bacterium]
MFYHLLYEGLSRYISPFNVFKYITFRAAYAAITALLICLIMGTFVIKKLKSLNFGESIRWEIMDTHNHKAGTPTMGGLLILASLIISTLLWARLDNAFVGLAIFSAIWFGFIGFLDDYSKVRKKGGIRAWQKLAAQGVGALVIAIYMYIFVEPSTGGVPSTALCFPFLKEIHPNLSLFFIPFAMIVIMGASNAVNLTDGLDGLAVGCTLFVAITYSILSYTTSHFAVSTYLNIVHLPQAGELAVFCAALTGASLGFLWYNAHPAQVFMGDTGALALGGALGTVAVFTKNEILLVVVGGIFVAEVLSVIIQVSSFKTRGKRVFKKTPIHHHFLLMGWPETKVVIRFWIIAAILLLATLSTLKIR